MASPSRKRSANVPPCEPSHNDAVVSQLTDWFRHQGRPLPFRRHHDAYAIWVSEIMLQQTQVNTVLPYFERWMVRFPNVGALAAATEDEVLSSWQGLGYYSRGRNLHRAARLLVRDHGGRLPQDPEQLLALPGIGRYTAGAIASIAYNRPEPIVDGNVIRVLTRLYALRGDPRAQPLSETLWARARELVECSTPRLFNQALMELGALLCTRVSPRCALCPVLPHCRGKKQGLVDVLPELAERPRVEKHAVCIFWSQHHGRVFLLRQSSEARHWAGLYVLPYVELQVKTASARRAALVGHLRTLHPRAEISSFSPLGRISYPITRFRFDAQVIAATIPDGATDGRYFTAQQCEHLALPAPHRKLLKELFTRTPAGR